MYVLALHLTAQHILLPGFKIVKHVMSVHYELVSSPKRIARGTQAATRERYAEQAKKALAERRASLEEVSKPVMHLVRSLLLFYCCVTLPSSIPDHSRYSRSFPIRVIIDW